MKQIFFILASTCILGLAIGGCKSTTENSPAAAALEPAADQCKLTLSVTGMR